MNEETFEALQTILAYMTSDCADDELDILIELLQRKMQRSKVERLILKELRTYDIKEYEVHDATDLCDFYFDIVQDEVVMQLDLYKDVHWDYIYGQLKNG